MQCSWLGERVATANVAKVVENVLRYRNFYFLHFFIFPLFKFFIFLWFLFTCNISIFRCKIIWLYLWYKNHVKFNFISSYTDKQYNLIIPWKWNILSSVLTSYFFYVRSILLETKQRAAGDLTLSSDSHNTEEREASGKR